MDKYKISCTEKNEVVVFNAADATVNIWEQDDGMLVEVNTTTISAQGLIKSKSRSALDLYGTLESGNFLNVDDLFVVNVLEDEDDEEEDEEMDEEASDEKGEDEDW